MSATTLTILAIVWLLSAVITGAAASGRGRDGAVWAIVGLLLGPVAILIIAIFGEPDA